MLGDRRRIGAALSALAAAAALLLALPHPGEGHPLGNFSINRYTALHLSDGAIDIRYVVDMAEIPTFQELQEAAMPAEPEHPRVAAYARRTAHTLMDTLVLTVNGQPRVLNVVSQTIVFPPGAGGLPTLRLAISYRIALDERGTLRIGYRDGNFAERAGWKEIIATASAAVSITESSVPDRDRSRELTDYPTALLATPPQVTEALVTAEPRPIEQAATPPPVVSASRKPSPASRRPAASSPPAASAPTPERDTASIVSSPEPASRSATPRSAFTELATIPRLSGPLVLFAILVAVGLGALHALEPGHGKSVVAAYLVGSRGTARHALFLGVVVTASHTAAVYLLGAATLYASRTILPERLYPWLGALSGIVIAILGATLFIKRLIDASGHHHPHDHDHMEHDHGPGHHHHDHHRHHHVPSGDVSLRTLFALGITGGIIPCPGALVVLLSAISLGRIGFGLVLITAFSVGLAAVLVAIGLVLVHAQRALARFSGENILLTRWLLLTSSALVAGLGVAIAVQALIAGGIVQVRLS